MGETKTPQELEKERLQGLEVHQVGNHFKVSSTKEGGNSIEIDMDSELGQLLQKEFEKPENIGKSQIVIPGNTALGKMLLKEIAKQNKNARNQSASFGRQNKKPTTRKRKKKAFKARPIGKKRPRETVFQTLGFTSKSAISQPAKGVQKESKPEDPIKKIDLSKFEHINTLLIARQKFVEDNKHLLNSNKNVTQSMETAKVAQRKPSIQR